MLDMAVPENRVFEFIHDDNMFCPRAVVSEYLSSTEDQQCDDLIVWGGVVANNGEDQLSRIVDSSRHRLRSITYCPDRTKGGCLVRPKYHVGDRGGKVLFPQLTDMTIRLSPSLLPDSHGWIMPNLRRLRLIAVISASFRQRDIYGRTEVDRELPSIQCLRKWLKTGARAFPEQLLEACPHLECITVAFASTAEADRQEIDWVDLLPSQSVPWSVCRLLLLAVLKPHHVSMSEASVASPLSSLDIQLASTVLSFLGRPTWFLKQRTIEPSDAERLQIPSEVYKADMTDILESTTNEW